jgi:4-amino-4-deoxy-L-arabinose transferase-like glycosyltransferase
MATTDRAEAENKRYLVLLLVLVAAALWIIPLGSSLTTDETGTYWVIKDGLRDVITRSRRFQGQTPTYYVIEWMARHVGRSEVALRLPSIAALALGTYLLFRLARYLFDAETGLLAAIAFATLGSVAVAAADVRPYAFAVTATIAATLALIRWLDRGRIVDGVAYVVLAALSVYFHYLFGAALAVHAIYAILRVRAGAAVKARDLGWVLLALTLALLPAAGQASSLLGRRSTLSSWAPEFSIEGFFRRLLPPALVAGTLAGILVARAIGSRIDPVRPRADVPALILTWVVVPPLLVFIAARATQTSVFTPRYILSAAPGLALAAGWSLRSLRAPQARRAAALTLALVALLANLDPSHGDQDWIGAIGRVNSMITDPSTPVLFQGGFTESAQIDWLTDPERASYLDAPLAYYPVRGRVSPLPLSLTSAAQPYLEGLAGLVRSSARFFVVTVYYPFDDWLDGRLADFSRQSVGTFGIVKVTLFERSS